MEEQERKLVWLTDTIEISLEQGGKAVTQKERIAMQRALAEEALGKMRAISQLFGAEDKSCDAAIELRDAADCEAWVKKVDELSAWIWGESPIA